MKNTLLIRGQMKDMTPFYQPAGQVPDNEAVHR